MSIYLICLTANGGLPILTRRKGNCENLPFSTVASLNGLHMFFKSLGVELYTTYANNWTYVWHDYCNIITIIFCFSGISSYAAELLPDIVYGAFSLFISEENMSHQSLLDRLKKESKNYLPLIDAALENCVTQYLGYSTCLFSSKYSQMMQYLNEELTIQCGSLFCCLVIGHKTVVATDGWWDLDIIDRQLLLLLLQTSNSFENEYAVYLPKKSANVAYRFITIPVGTNGAICVICGAELTLRTLHNITEATFKNESNQIHSMERSIPQGLPEHIELDSSIIAISVANNITRKCVFAINIQHSISAKRFRGDLHNLDILKKIFGDTLSNIDFLKANISNNTSELIDQYWSLESYKCMSHIDGNGNIIVLLYISSMPLHTMRNIGKKIFAQIIHEI